MTAYFIVWSCRQLFCPFPCVPQVDFLLKDKQVAFKYACYIEECLSQNEKQDVQRPRGRTHLMRWSTERPMHVDGLSKEEGEGPGRGAWKDHWKAGDLGLGQWTTSINIIWELQKMQSVRLPSEPPTQSCSITWSSSSALTEGLSDPQFRLSYLPEQWGHGSGEFWPQRNVTWSPGRCDRRTARLIRFHCPLCPLAAGACATPGLLRG